MAFPQFRPFPTGYRLTEGFKLNKLFNGQEGISPALVGLALPPAVVAAFGASQGNATQIPSTTFAVSVTVTASTEGVKLPAAATNKSVLVLANPTIGAKVYPFAGDIIGSAATNAAFALVKNTSTLFVAVDSVHWRLFKGS